MVRSNLRQSTDTRRRTEFKFELTEIPMTTLNRLATQALILCIFAACALAQDPEVVPPAAALANITEGQGIITSSGNPQWDGLSELVLIPGASLLGASSPTTGLYLGFTGGSTVDIDNMVLYTTPRNGSVITATKKLTLNKVSNPSIVLTNKTTLDSNNEAIAGAGVSFDAGGLSGWSLYGDWTRIGKEGAMPTGNAGQGPFFLLYVTNQ
jgi:hypothetical protein